MWRLLLLLALLAAPARADDPEPRVRVKAQCEKVGGPGRVRCELEARVSGGAKIRWGDVEIVRTPPFASPLKGRVGPRDATARDDDAWRWSFALVAREAGTGDVDLRVRTVICNAEGARCVPGEALATARVQVGD